MKEDMRIDVYPSKVKHGCYDVHIDGVPHETYRNLSIEQLADAIDTVSTAAAKQAGKESTFIQFEDGSSMKKDIGD